MVSDLHHKLDLTIFNIIHSRTAIGTLTLTWNRGQKIILLQPRDVRLPRVLIQNKNVSFNMKEFFKNPARFEDYLYKTKIIDWIKPQFAIGGKLELVGDKNDIKTETKAILTEFDLDTTPFPADLEREILAKIENISKSEFDGREDLTKDCVFSIDPETARDLDDALSLKILKNGNYEIGVHIADVSFYLSEATKLDELVSKKATTIYLVDKVYHMLPEVMCQNLSLLPGKKSLTFSVFWEFSKDDLTILNHRFSRTVINNCCQLSYEHAQKMIDNEPIKNFPKIYNTFQQKDLKKIICKLQEIAVILRKDRIDSGALRINQVKIGFHLDPETGNPLDFFRCVNTESNRLIEEFMLLANTTVAKRILNDFPDLAFLRCHEPPNPRLIGDVKKMLEIVGIILDVSSSGGIQRSLQEYSSDTFLGITRNAALNHLLAKPMTRARYFCAGVEENYEHYALSTPIYTHFTSPIRRYADVMVHRLLAASLGYTSKPNWTIDHVIETAANCNKQKYNAKRAGEVQSDLFLLHYIENHQPFVVEAVVVEVREKFFDVLVLSTGSIVRIYVKDINVPYSAEKIGTNSEKPFWRLKLDFGESEKKVIEIFEIINVALSRKQKSNCLHGQMVVKTR
nr:DIS3-like exonuclease 2 [Onthophagus taurus]